MSLYFIALIPPEDLKKQIQKIKEEVKEKFGAKHALKLPAHITLQPPFKTDEKNEKKIIQDLKDLADRQEAFEIKLSDFGAFPPRVLFIKVVELRKIIELHTELQKRIDEIVGLKERERTDNIHPHITIATRDLNKTSFREAWAEFRSRNFHSTFLAESLFLLKHNGKTWDILQELKFGK